MTWLLALLLLASEANATEVIDGMTIRCRPVGPKVYVLASTCGEDGPSRVVEDGGAIHPGECFSLKVVNGANAGRSRCKAKLRKGICR